MSGSTQAVRTMWNKIAVCILKGKDPDIIKKDTMKENGDITRTTIVDVVTDTDTDMTGTTISTLETVSCFC